jgi:hypothetical protein
MLVEMVPILTFRSALHRHAPKQDSSHGSRLRPDVHRGLAGASARDRGHLLLHNCAGGEHMDRRNVARAPKHPAGPGVEVHTAQASPTKARRSLFTEIL